MRRISLLILLLAATCGARAASPRDYAFPVRDAARLYAANFGEMRPGHFHAGIDIKTDGAEGKPLVAAANGYVSRVTVAPGGYGRALYLTLADGTTAVYGHLLRFRDDIERHVEAERRRHRANDVDLHFGPEAWPVRRGDRVGLSGNSGSSMGPHLHYELRETASGRRLNIVREGIVRPHDDLPPRILRLHYAEIDSLDEVCVRAPMQSYPILRAADGSYRPARREAVEVGRRGYFVAEVTDRRNGVHNTFGIWRLTAWIDGERYFEYRMDGFTPDLARCCDAVSCYPLQLDSRCEAIRLAQLDRAPACFYPCMVDRGVVRTEPGERRRLRIEVEDDCGNRSSVEIDLVGRTGSFRARRKAPDADSTARPQHLLHPDRPATLGIGREATCRIPAGALYEPLFCRPAQRPAPRAPEGVVVLSPAYRFLEVTTPLRQAAQIAVAASVPRSLRLRAALARTTRRGGLAFVGGHYTEGRIAASCRTAGDFAVVADTMPPRIRPLFEEGADLSSAETLRFRVGDNFSGVASCALHIDGEWVPCDRYPMQSLLFHRFDGQGGRRRHEAELTVTDASGNTARWRGVFFR